MALLPTQPGANGCSGGVSKAWRIVTGKRPPFEWCCDEHDLAYDEGGTSADRRLADKRLRECVAWAGYPRFAWVVWLGARAGGWMFWAGNVQKEGKK
jgi:hypothetical protein